jgi:hypothetical protein
MIKCPRCDYKYDLIGDEANQALVAVIKMAGAFAPHSGLMLEYALVRGAGKPIQGKELKLLRIMEDLEKLWTSESFSFEKKKHQISRSGIVWCLKTVCNKTFLAPLENNNYLKKIMITVAEREGRERSAKLESELIRRERSQRQTGRSGDGGTRGNGELGLEARKLKFKEFRDAIKKAPGVEAIEGLK